MNNESIIKELQFKQAHELESLKAAIQAEIEWRKVQATITPEDEEYERMAMRANQD